MSVEATRTAVEALFAAIESRDLRRVDAALSSGATWQNVPDDPARGRHAVVGMLADILRWSDEVRWSVERAEYGSTTARVVRLDRFRIDGDEHSVHCDGEFDVDPVSGRVTAVRDRADLDDWRARITPVYGRMRSRDAVAVVGRHLDAVRRRDPVAMAADYALDAVLQRGATQLVGWAAIASYFDGVPARLGSSTLAFGPIEAIDSDTAAVAWRISVGTGTVASGRDVFETADGFIARQVVALDGSDF